jgi:hypothetical protein
VQEWERTDELVAAFGRWAAAQRTESAATSRARERSLREQAAASATWIGTLVDLAEHRTEVTVAVNQKRRRGRLVGVGRDFCVLDHAGQGQTDLVALGAVSALWPDPAATPFASGARDGTIDLTLSMAFALLVEQRARIRLVTRTGDETAGDLITAGEDLLTVRTEPPTRRLVYVPLGAVAICELH